MTDFNIDITPISFVVSHYENNLDKNIIFEDLVLDTFFGQLVTKILGNSVNFVRPRWQPVPPRFLDNTINWCAIGVIDQVTTYVAPVVHHSNGDGYDELQQHEQLRILATFYGPNAGSNSKIFRDGLVIQWNRDELFHNHMMLASAEFTTRNVPEIINDIWFRRVDIEFKVNRVITRFYPIPNILIAQGIIKSDEPEQTETWIVPD